jgi:hypothetical protein
MNAPSLAELRAMSDQELVRMHDDTKKKQHVGIEYFREELARRDRDRQTRAMLRYTRWITVMTVVMTIATIINVLLALFRN